MCKTPGSAVWTPPRFHSIWEQLLNFIFPKGGLNLEDCEIAPKMSETAHNLMDLRDAIYAGCVKFLPPGPTDYSRGNLGNCS